VGRIEGWRTYQVTKSGAEMLASSLDSSILFKYTIDMDTTQYAQITPKTYMKLFFPDIFAAIQGGSTTAA
jgi:hypothetical protein